MKDLFWIVLILVVAFFHYDKVRYARKQLKEETSLQVVPMRDYQIEIHMDTVWLYDGNRLVGSYISDWQNQMDTLLITDNQ